MESGVTVMEDIARWIEWVGVLILLLSLLLTIVRATIAAFKRTAPSAIYVSSRSFLGRGILLGLEVLIAADLIRTVAVAPTLDNAFTLGIIVLIRTFLSFSLDVEITGQLPWREGKSSQEGGGSPAQGKPGPGADA